MKAVDISGKKEIATRIANALSAANIISVASLGTYLHIEIYEKYEKYVTESLVQGGFEILMAKTNWAGNFMISAQLK